MPRNESNRATRIKGQEYSDDIYGYFGGFAGDDEGFFFSFKMLFSGRKLTCTVKKDEENERAK